MNLIILLFLFGLKHFLGDWLFQRNGLSGMKRLAGLDGIKALFLHSFIHGLFTYVFIWYYLYFTSRILNFTGWFLTIGLISFLIGFIDFAFHFVIDFAKVKVEKHMKSGFGIIDDIFSGRSLMMIDQGLHLITYLVIIYILLT